MGWNTPLPIIRDKIGPSGTKWMNCEMIMLSEISKEETGNYERLLSDDFTYMWNKNN